ncbi:phospholipase c [Stylonychia lemnae]|uniref:Phospholipase c n=1 Tax=Stylonychia lemnae TaxID=5949 RepID=A0A078B298_STYLE|nr:phospholipase c [Stylonychia lemnae]|eukprot:CDW88660.1 phospholipase c [Stylonychia lemnae]
MLLTKTGLRFFSYGQYIKANVVNGISESPIQVTNFKLPWGKLCQRDDQDKEIHSPYSDVQISPKAQRQFFCGGRKSIPFGTEGSFDIQEGDNLVGTFYFDCPFSIFGTNKQQWTQHQNNYVVQINPQSPKSRGALGLVTISPPKNIFAFLWPNSLTLLIVCMTLIANTYQKPLVSLTSTVQDNTARIFMIQWEATPLFSVLSPWVGVYRIISPDTAPIMVFETQGQRQGYFMVTLPDVDFYEARYFQRYNNKDILITTGDLIQVENNEAIITLSASFKDEKGDEVPIVKIDWVSNVTQDNDQIFLYRLGQRDPVWQFSVEKQGAGATQYTVSKGQIGYYYAQYSQRGIDSFKMSNIIQVKESSPNFITIEGQTVSGKCKITWSTDFQTNQDTIQVKLGRINELADINKLKYLVETQDQSQQSVFNHRYENEAGTYMAYLYRNQQLIAVSNLVRVRQPEVNCPAKKGDTMSNIKNIVILIPENHSFLSYWGDYCEAPPGSNPTCNDGPKCCETYPKIVDGAGPIMMDDDQEVDRNHLQICQICRINGGKMDKFIKGCHYPMKPFNTPCSSENNFAIATKEIMKTYHQMARDYAISDRYFQASAGQSSQNDMYFARAAYVFKNNDWVPNAKKGSRCLSRDIPTQQPEKKTLFDPTIASLLDACDQSLAFYAEGYDASSTDSIIPEIVCFPKHYDNSDVPFQYYAPLADNPNFNRDYNRFWRDVHHRTLPQVSFIKALGMRTGHPGTAILGGTLTQCQDFAQDILDIIQASPTYRNQTLFVIAEDESGGFYDHISPPPTSPTDNIPYGARISNLFLGHFAKKNYISHDLIEHSSLIKFIEWNWLNGETGQLNTRDSDSQVNNIGDLLDISKTGTNPP